MTNEKFAAAPAQAVAVPLQQFESPRAQILLRAFQEGWGACRDAEYAGEEAENDAFNRSATLGHCISEDQLHRPVAPLQEPDEPAGWIEATGERYYTSAQVLAMGRVPLTDEQIEQLPVWKHFIGLWPESRKEIARAIEAAHGIVNPTGD